MEYNMDEGLMLESDIPAVIDTAISDEDMSIRLRGSIIRATAGGTTKFYAVPATGAVYDTKASTGARLQVIDKWGQAAKQKRLADLDAVVPSLS